MVPNSKATQMLASPLPVQKALIDATDERFASSYIQLGLNFSGSSYARSDKFCLMSSTSSG